MCVSRSRHPPRIEKAAVALREVGPPTFYQEVVFRIRIEQRGATVREVGHPTAYREVIRRMLDAAIR